MSQLNLTVGQIVFLKLQKGKIMPARVFEEIRRKNLKGEIVSYVFQSRINGELKTYEYDSTVELFRSPEEAKNRMIQEATVFIEKICSDAEREARETFAPQEESFSHPQQTAKKQQPQQTRIVLEDGTVANISI